MDPEVLFLKYAFPCSVILRQRGEITQEQFDELEEAATKDNVLPRHLLENVYHRAFEKMKMLFPNRDIWSTQVITAYFREKHNKLINDGMFDYGKAPPVLKKLCKVQEAEVLSLEKGIAVVKFGDETRPVYTSMLSNPEVGDRVTIHYGYAVEILRRK